MPTYLVRLNAEEENPRDFVGVFVAQDVDQLREFVDECCPTDACEFTELPEGGVYLSSPSLPIPHDLDENEEGDFFKGAMITESWFGSFISSEDGAEWEPLEDAEG